MAGPTSVDIFPRSAVSVRKFVGRDPNDRSIDSMEVFQSLMQLPFVCKDYVRQSERSP